MSDLEQICLRLLSSNELFFPPFRIPFEKRGCLSETDLHHQRIVVPPQSAAAEIGRWRQYADGMLTVLPPSSILSPAFRWITTTPSLFASSNSFCNSGERDS